MVFIDRKRQFVEWRERDGELSEPELYARFGFGDKSKGGPDLCELHRVVVLAKAGSGKTDELKEQARRLSASPDIPSAGHAYIASLHPNHQHCP